MKYQMTGNSRMVFAALLAVCLVFGMVQIGFAARHDFNGETVTFFIMEDGFNRLGGGDSYYEQGPNRAWLEEVEEMFNVNIEFNSANRRNFRQEVMTGMIAGDPPGDIFWTRQDFMLWLANQDVLYPLDGIVNDEYYQRIPELYRNKDFYEFLGTPIAFSSNDIWTREGLPFTTPAGIAWNKDLFDELNLPDLFELQESGNWTYDALIDIAMQATRDTTGDGELDQWGVAGYRNGLHWHQLLMAMVSNDATWVRIDEDGKGTVTITEPAFIDALQLWQDLVNVHGAVPRSGLGVDGGKPNHGRDVWNEGNLAMIFGDMNALADAKSNDTIQDWGWVYYPKGPNAEDYVAYAHLFHVASLGHHVENPEALVELASALFRSADPYMLHPKEEYLERGLDQLAREGYVNDRDSLETFRKMYSNMQALPFFREFFVLQDGIADAASGIRDGELFAPAAMAALQPAIQTALDEYLGQ